MRRWIWLWLVLAAGTLFLMHRAWPAAGFPLPDLRWHYTPAELYQWVVAMSPEERYRFLFWHLTLDFWWPMLYGSLLVFLSWKLTEQWPVGRWLLSGTAVVAVLSDFAENTALVLYLWSFPGEGGSWAQVAAMATTVKWLLIAFVLVALLSLGFHRLVRFLRAT